MLLGFYISTYVCAHICISTLYASIKHFLTLYLYNLISLLLFSKPRTLSSFLFPLDPSPVV